jgi:membrane fusion protein (multidrug efflux system)
MRAYTGSLSRRERLACRQWRAAIIAAAVLAVSGCGRSGSPDDGPPQRPPTDVVVEEVAAGPAPNLLVLSGRVEAGRSVQVRARADGILERQLFVEGTTVAQGAPLFEIDRRDLASRQRQAQAAVASTTAARTNARSVFNRISALLPRNAVSRQEFENAQSALQQAEAAVAEANAALERATLQLDHATVRAPVSGRIGRAQVSEGALVSAASATLMAQIDQLDPVSVVFNPSSSMIADIRHQIETGQVKVPDNHNVPVTILQDDGTPTTLAGTVDFADAVVDPATGSQVLRARFDNPDQRLLPGEFVRASIEAGTKLSGVTIPGRAVSIGADAASVLVVGADNTVHQQPVVLGGQSGGRWLVQDGIKPGERVIVDGWHKVRVGEVVNPVPAGAGTAE